MVYIYFVMSIHSHVEQTVRRAFRMIAPVIFSNLSASGKLKACVLRSLLLLLRRSMGNHSDQINQELLKQLVGYESSSEIMPRYNFSQFVDKVRMTLYYSHTYSHKDKARLSQALGKSPYFIALAFRAFARVFQGRPDIASLLAVNYKAFICAYDYASGWLGVEAQLAGQNTDDSWRVLLMQKVLIRLGYQSFQAKEISKTIWDIYLSLQSTQPKDNHLLASILLSYIYPGYNNECQISTGSCNPRKTIFNFKDICRDFLTLASDQCYYINCSPSLKPKQIDLNLPNRPKSTIYQKIILCVREG